MQTSPVVASVWHGEVSWCLIVLLLWDTGEWCSYTCNTPQACSNRCTPAIAARSNSRTAILGSVAMTTVGGQCYCIVKGTATKANDRRKRFIITTTTATTNNYDHHTTNNYDHRHHSIITITPIPTPSAIILCVVWHAMVRKFVARYHRSHCLVRVTSFV